MLLARTNLLDRARLEQGFETTHTTSPAGAPLASIDGVRALLETRGAELLGALIDAVVGFKNEIQAQFDIPIFLNETDFESGRFDPCKIVLRANQLGASGVDIERKLQAKNIRVEMADRDTIVFLATLVDTEQTLRELAAHLIPILHDAQSAPRESATALSWAVKPLRGSSMRDAYFAATEMVLAADAIGKISADLVAPYPPGVAVLAPGEIITSEIVEGLASAKRAGVRIAYATDATLETYRVVK